MTSVREIVLEAYTSLPKGTPGPRFADTGEVVPGGPKTIDLEVLAAQERYLRMTAREIRRLCMLLLAFIRQDVREKRFGFLKGTEVWLGGGRGGREMERWEGGREDGKVGALGCEGRR
jgi:hypothetical protein